MAKMGIAISNPTGIYDPRSHAYSHVAKISQTACLVYIAGQGGSRLQEDLPNDFRKQVQIVFENIGIALSSQGLSFQEVFKVTTLIVDYDEDKHKILIEEFTKIWPELNFPVNTLIPVPRLALKGMLVEIDAIAAAVSAANI